MRLTWKRLAIAGLATLASVLMPVAGQAQARGGHIEKVSNKRLSGSTLRTLPGLTYEDCERRCLDDSRCVALEHFRGGRIFNRGTQCKLLSSIGEARDNRYADVGYRRAGPGNTAKADRRTSNKKSAAAAEATPPEEPKAGAQPAGGAAPPSTPPAGGAAPSPADTARQQSAQQQQQATQPPPGRWQGPGESGTGTGGGAYTRERTGAPRSSESSPPSLPPAAAQAPARESVERSIARPAPPPPAAATAPPPRPPAPVTAAPPPAPLPEAVTSPVARSRSVTRPMVAPRAESGGEAGRTEPEWDVVPVFYGTDRNRQDKPKRIAYGSDRARKLEVGRALVTVPKSHQVPNVERPWAIKIPYIDVTLYQEAEDPKRHFTIQELRSLSKDEMLALVRQRLQASTNFKDQALVIIHGYNNAFDDALYRTAQIAYDLKYDGAPFLYSWPSGGGITSYPYDRESAQQAEQYLSQFLLMVLNETGAKSISLIAHSMGNQPLLQVLRDLRRTNPDVSRINQIILAAPDVDRDAFEYLAGQIRGVGQGITMYVSSNDVALGVSRRFAGGIPRAGDVPDGLGPAVISGVDTIDVSGLSTDYFALNHSTYAEKTALLKDIELILRTGVRPPEQRMTTLQRITGEKGDYWRYSE